MTPNNRLDQIEPVLGEVIAQQNLHAAQLRRANANIVTLIETVTQQSDDITFLLKGQAELQTGQAELQTGQAELQTGQAELQAGQAELQAGQAELHTKIDSFQAENRAKFDQMQQTLSAILNAVQKPSGN
jgi:uncharacterized phage infection (PIP) family protein YhgE